MGKEWSLWIWLRPVPTAEMMVGRGGLGVGLNGPTSGYVRMVWFVHVH
jgi:hypothetical protein